MKSKFITWPIQILFGITGVLLATGCRGSEPDDEHAQGSEDTESSSDTSTYGDSDTGSEGDADSDGDSEWDSDSEGALEVELVSVDWGTNCYLLGNDTSVAVIDPGSRADLIEGAVKDRNVEYVILTHGHFDHITALDELAEIFPKAVIAIHESDEDYLYDTALNLSTNFTGQDYVFGGESDLLLKGEEILEIAGETIRVIHTPGHSPGGICILQNKTLLSGDTLMFEGIGLTEDIPLADKDQLIQSIQQYLFVLDEDVTVYPGHGPTTTIGYEIKNNPEAS